MMGSRTLGYIIAAAIFAPLAWWAKVSPAGMTALIVTFVLFFAVAIVMRVRDGHWPGD